MLKLCLVEFVKSKNDDMSLLVHFRIQKSCFRWSLTLWRARSSCSCAEIATAEKLSYDTTKREGVLTISNFLAIKKMWAQISFALVLFTSVSGKNRTDYLYNGDGKVVLSLEKPFKIEAGKPWVSRYRIVAEDGSPDTAKLDAVQRAFAGAATGK